MLGGVGSVEVRIGIFLGGAMFVPMWVLWMAMGVLLVAAVSAWLLLWWVGKVNEW